MTNFQNSRPQLFSSPPSPGPNMHLLQWWTSLITGQEVRPQPQAAGWLLLCPLPISSGQPAGSCWRMRSVLSVEAAVPAHILFGDSNLLSLQNPSQFCSPVGTVSVPEKWYCLSLAGGREEKDSSELEGNGNEKLGCRESPEEKECRNGSDECLGQPGDSADALCLCLHQRREPEGIY